MLTTTMDQKTAPIIRVPSAMALRMLTCLEGMEMFSQIQSTIHYGIKVEQGKEKEGRGEKF